MSKQPRKQRKARFTAPLHQRHKLMAVTLSEELREKLETRSLPVRKGDTVMVMRGDFKDQEGKVEKVDHRNYCLFIDGVSVQKPDGNQTYHPVHPSNVMMVDMELDDEERNEAIERKG